MIEITIKSTHFCIYDSLEKFLRLNEIGCDDRKKQVVFFDKKNTLTDLYK